MVGRSADAVDQPGAQVGDSVHCPVSGVVFEVTDSSPHIEVGDRPVYTCCKACARYLETNRDRVLSSRGIEPST